MCEIGDDRILGMRFDAEASVRWRAVELWQTDLSHRTWTRWVWERDPQTVLYPEIIKDNKLKNFVLASFKRSVSRPILVLELVYFWTVILYFTWGSANLSVMVACRKLPIRVKLELELSKFIVTAQSWSLFCFFSKQMANAQPTA